ncbi:uncharacterized protein SCHCODRAFT_02688792 [Schizophyllum commune H4-8]|uniref:F-box domain-containing protein n=1 Tax=Schizophyllum commune (strain H4-8 / FGSC 9210) TaxID=578458 RepID=D8Q4X7_SCHCM|nr:uncharacterized protein SCHCODRAFT_02688792 [Schizophyllum commune H4-8]KAI5892423.1 hypothetical protein SCHCODRAFT_02688792 [Schizophyllum commune H4-8]
MASPDLCPSAVQKHGCGKTLQLPVELLTEVFRYCIESARPGPNMVPGCAALHLAHVCHLWRGVAMDSPRLWTHLRIPCPHRGQGPHSDCIQLCDDWIQRSSPHTITIELPSGTESCMTGRLAQDVLAKHGSRIVGLSLYLAELQAEAQTREQAIHCASGSSIPVMNAAKQDNSETMRSFLTLPSGTFPTLTSLQLRTKLPFSKLSQQVTSFDGSPHLRHLALKIQDGLSNLTQTTLPNLPWTELESLTLSLKVFNNDTGSFLEQLTSLRSLSLDVWFLTVSQPSNELSTYSRDRRRHEYNDCRLYDALACPALETLRITLNDHRSTRPDDSPPLALRFFDSVNFHCRSLCSLRELHIRNHWKIPALKMLEILDYTAQLEVLALCSSVELRPLLFEWIWSPKGMIRNLRSLSICYRLKGEPDEDFAALKLGVKAMIIGRWGLLEPDEESPLREVDIMPTKHEFDKEWVDNMESLRPAGAKLRLGPTLTGLRAENTARIGDGWAILFPLRDGAPPAARRTTGEVYGIVAWRNAQGATPQRAR